MESHVRVLLNRVSLVSAAVATLSLLYVLSHNSLSCRPLESHHRRHASLTLSLSPFPRSSCDAAARRPLPSDKRSKRLQSTAAWRLRVDAFAALCAAARGCGVLRTAPPFLCVSAGAGHEVAALHASGVADVTGVDLVDFPPHVRRADPHNLPFFDGVFDLGFSAGLDQALFPLRFVGEMERTVRRGGAVVVAVGRCNSEEEVGEVKGLFKRSAFVRAFNVTLVGSEMTVVIMRRNAKHP